MRVLPPFAILLGLAGLLPFVGASLGAVSLEGDGSLRALLALIAYGAVILAFLGGVHWGVALDAGAGQLRRVQRARFGFGVLPSLAGWAALLLAFYGWPRTGVGLLAAAFVAITVGEARAARLGLIPRSYMALRWVLSTLVIVCLVSVLIVLVLGGHVPLWAPKPTTAT